VVRPRRVLTNVVSTRLKRFESATRDWLQSKAIRVSKLRLMPCDNWDEQANWTTGKFKASVYMNTEAAEVFFEGDPGDARAIFEITHRPVFCVKTKTLYQ
jgi:hypothetical protein